MEPEAGLAWFRPRRRSAPPGAGHPIPRPTSGPSPAARCTTIPACASPASRSSPVRAVASGARPNPFPAYLAMLAVLAGSTHMRLAFDRFDQFQAGLKRPASTLRGACGWPPTGASSRSTPTSRFDAGGRANLCAYVASMAALSVGGAYRVPYAVARGSAFASREVQAGSQRGFGGAEARSSSRRSSTRQHDPRRA